jgi:aspartyl-tRNA(Asn)/glutamyl-tRNA(Gln) amidotransferase subunit A
MRKLFREVDLLLTPTEPIVAPSFEEARDMSPLPIIRNTRPFNVAGVPTISVPCGFDAKGLPIGLSLAGRMWEEATVLRAAHAYQLATDWHLRRPQL